MGSLCGGDERPVSRRRFSFIGRIMNTRKTVALALVLVISVLYLTKVLMPSREREVSERKALSGISEDQIARIDVALTSSQGQLERYAIVQNGPKKVAAEANNASQGKAQWSLPAVRGALLDTNLVGEFVKAVRDLPLEDSLSERELNADLSVYGLDRPVLTVVVDKGAGESVEVAFGKRNEYLSKRYTKVSGRAGVFLVPDSFYSNLSKGSSDLRSKNPLQFNVIDVREVAVTSTEGFMKVLQPAVGEWKIVEPRALPASTDAVDALLNSLRGLTVTEFIQLNTEAQIKNSLDKQYGFDKPKATFELKMRDGAEPAQITVSLAQRAAAAGGTDEFFIQIGGVDSFFRLSADPTQSLVKKVNDLRNRSIVSLTASNIESVVSAGSGITPTTISASGLLWTVNGKESDPVFMEQYLQDLATLKAEDFADTPPADALEAPFLQLTITTKGPEKDTITLVIGKEFSKGASTGAGGTEKSSDSQRYVKSSKSETVYIIRDVEAKRLIPHEEALMVKATPTAEATGAGK